MPENTTSIRAFIASLFSRSKKGELIPAESQEQQKTPEDEKLIFFNERQWVNDEDSSFTGSIVCHLNLTKSFYKTSDNVYKSMYDVDGFVEFSDCQNKLRYHTDYGEKTEEMLIKYKNKITRLRDYLEEYRLTLEEALEIVRNQPEEKDEQ